MKITRHMGPLPVAIKVSDIILGVPFLFKSEVWIRGVYFGSNEGSYIVRLRDGMIYTVTQIDLAEKVFADHELIIHESSISSNNGEGNDHLQPCYL